MENKNKFGKINYDEIQLKIGIEIHQQLEGKKLFCNCPTLIRDDTPHFSVTRNIRASAGELGKVDIAAEQEQRKQKYYIYESYTDTNCLVELDEEPPHELNQDALKTGLQVSKLLNAEIVDAIQFMRKIVVNGSNTSGFQRTGLIATNGHIVIDGNKIRIPTILLEEDSAKTIKQEKDYVIYRLDRLGIPLIEIGTMPDIHDPITAQNAASYLGMILRSTGSAKRGLGTIRQDVNISIFNGNRVELKGVQDLKQMITVIDNECHRQMNLLKIRDELIKRKFKEIKTPFIKDLTKLFVNSESKFIKKAIDVGGKITALRVDKFNGLIGYELMPNYRFGSELAGIAKVFGFGGIIHSDEDMSKYQIDNVTYEKIITELSLKKDDGFILIVGDELKAISLINNNLVNRINYAIVAVPKEVRNAKDDCTNAYMRPMPGASRMYPETDIPIVYPDLKNIELPELIDDKIKRISKKYDLNLDLCETIVKDNKSNIFENIANNLKKNNDIKTSYIADFLSKFENELKDLFNKNKKQYSDYLFSKIKDEDIIELFNLVDKGKITKESIIMILYDYLVHATFENSVKKYSLISRSELKKELELILEENRDLSEKIKDKDRLKKTLLGIAMGKLKFNSNVEDISLEFDKIFE